MSLLAWTHPYLPLGAGKLYIDRLSYVHASNDTQADLFQKTQDDLRQPLRYGWSAWIYSSLRL